jgi:hypothetical protein
MYTKRFLILLEKITKVTSDSGATTLYFNRKNLQVFSATKQSQLKCKKCMLVSTIILLFAGIRTIEAKLKNDEQFPFCYVILLGTTINYLGSITSVFYAEDSAYAFSQLYRYAMHFSRKEGTF